MASFSAQMKAFENMTSEKATKVFKRTCLDLSSRIIKGTPVDSGRARGSWFPQINTFSDKINPVDDLDKSGSKSIARVSSTTNELKAGMTFTLSSNLPYIERLEYGYSKQSPAGMARINLMLFDKILNIANMETK